MKKYQINENCICCGACSVKCPVQAIYGSGNKFTVDQDKCIGCGTCAKTCLVKAPNQVDQ